MSALLYEMLRQNDFGDENPKVLLAISRLFPSDQFYYFTESLWRRWIKRDSAERFAAALDQCEANLRDHRIGAKVPFYVHILRTALSRASGPWIERALAFLTENQDQLSGELEYEMELNLQLDRYRRSAHLFVDGSPHREKIDRCIREFCTIDEQEAAERLVRTQLELAADSHALLDAVSFDKADYSAAYAALRWISHATNVRLGIDWAPPDHAKLWNATMRFMREVDSLDVPSAWQLLESVKAVLEFGALLRSRNDRRNSGNADRIHSSRLATVHPSTVPDADPGSDRHGHTLHLSRAQEDDKSLVCPLEGANCPPQISASLAIPGVAVLAKDSISF